MILDHEVGLARQRQAERIDVGGTHRGPVAVDDRHLGVQETLVVFADLDAGLEQRAVERPRSVMQQHVLHAPLQEQDNTHAALRRVDQGMAKAPAGKEIGVGDEDLVLGRFNGIEVGVFDVGTMPHVVPYHQGGTLPALGRHIEVIGRMHVQAAPQIRPRDPLPQSHRGFAHRPQQRAFDLHRVIEARRDVSRRVQVVDEVDAAQEPHAPVDHRDLAVQASQALPLQRPR